MMKWKLYATEVFQNRDDDWCAQVEWVAGASLLKGPANTLYSPYMATRRKAVNWVLRQAKAWGLPLKREDFKKE